MKEISHLNIPAHIVTTGIFIENPSHQILLINHPSRGWEIPGCVVDKGENLIESIQREMNNHGLFNGINHQLISIYSNIQEDSIQDRILPTKIIFDFRCPINDDYSLHDLENNSKWVFWTELNDMLCADIMNMRIANYLEFNKSLIYTSYFREPFEIKLRTFI